MTDKETNQQIASIEDLDTPDSDASEVKGGPVYIRWPDIQGSVTGKTDSSENTTPSSSNHNETVSVEVDHPALTRS